VIERAPHVTLLTTSRERLNVQSEWVFDVEGLGLADNDNGSASAVRLFVERARQGVPGFTVDDASQALRICRLVDGMPLGIELAASWVSMLSCAEIADEIEGNIDFLATSMRDVPERHRSLRAVIDQSWRLLADEQRDARSRSQAPTCASSPSSLRSRCCGVRTSAASSCTSCCASTRPNGSPPHPTSRRTPASGMRVTTRRCSWSGGRHFLARSSRSRGMSCGASWTTFARRPSGLW
jgi:hypothetical protein